MSRWRLVAFDLDGTLADTAGDIADAVNAAMRALGLPEHRDAAVRAMIGDGLTRLLERALGPAHAGRVEEARGHFREHYAAHLCDRTHAYPGIRELLATLHGRAAVATNKPGDWARAICHRLGFAPQLLAVLGDGDVPRRKPDPAIIDELRARAGASRGETIVVGDGMNDVEVARRSGVACCAVTWG